MRSTIEICDDPVTMQKVFAVKVPMYWLMRQKDRVGLTWLILKLIWGIGAVAKSSTGEEPVITGDSLYGAIRCLDKAPVPKDLKIYQVRYAWIKIGNTEVYVADIKENEDEMAIVQQIEAIERGWA